VSREHHEFDRVLILADESANWMVGGLRQLERLVLALNEFAQAASYGHEIAVIVFWEPSILPAKQWLPDNSRLVRIRPKGLVDKSITGEAPVLSTRLFVVRNGLGEFLRAAPPPLVELPLEPSIESWRKLASIPAPSNRNELWRILKQPGDVGPAERQLLRRTGKSQDGIISRYINRPISRFITRRLLRFAITPSACTVSMLVVPAFSYAFLIRGDYFGFVTGTALFQLANILDGCDGEIARAKYLESERGLRLDSLCDLVTNLLFILFLSIGLFRQPNASPDMRTVYLVEGITAVALIASRVATYAVGLISHNSKRPLDRRDGTAILDSSQRVFGGAITTLLVQLTKRDVIFFAFLVLAIAGLSSWILHIVFGFAVITMLLRLKNTGVANPAR